MSMRVRFAPSPTGQLHVGNARTALFNWLLARGSGGTFVLRIEDTDVERSTRESEAAILATCAGSGSTGTRARTSAAPCGPYRQSERLHLYESYAQRAAERRTRVLLLLLARRSSRPSGSAARRGRTAGALLGHAAARLTRERGRGADRRRRAPGHPLPRARRTARSSSPTRCAAQVRFHTDVIGDPVIVRADGTPAYNFAVVVDDALMGITHVIRGEDHISNTPRQMLLYEALGFTPPVFAHLALVLGPDHSPLSKRHGATSVAEFRAKGYLPEALVNYLALIGWSPRGRTTTPSCCRSTSWRAASRSTTVGHSAGVFDEEKLRG